MINHMVSGVYAQIAVKFFGDDLGELERLAKRAERLIQNVDGIAKPVVEPIRRTEELHIRLRPEDLAFYGVTRQYVGSVLQTALQGEVVSNDFESIYLTACKWNLRSWRTWSQQTDPIVFFARMLGEESSFAAIPTVVI